MNDQNTPKQKTEAPAPASGENLPDPEYKVGPHCPPKEHQFKKGAPSPYPQGRPRKDATLAPDLKKALEDALNKKVPVKSGERQVLVSKAVIGIEQLVNQFAKGDRHARRDLMDIAAKLGVDLLAGQKGRIEEALSVSHQAILDSYFARRPRPALAPPNKVIAPPELLDGIDMPAKTTRPVNRLPPKAAADPK
jgi:hypothetical protein